MLKLAVKARIPLIAVTCRDKVNFRDVFETVAGSGYLKYSSAHPESKLFPVFVDLESKDRNWPELYNTFVSKGCSLVIVNPKEVTEEMFDAGELLPTAEMVRGMITPFTVKEHIPTVTHTFSGLTLKEVGEIAKLAMTQAGGLLTSDTAAKMRRACLGGVKGLTPVSRELDFYYESEWVTSWCNLEGALLKSNAPDHLKDRGMLLYGPAGTGKTMTAKYIAKFLDRPLYLLDIGSVYSMYLGESNQNMQKLLRAVETYSPCVLLIDEVEKLFSKTSDSGVTQQMLSQLLWWLQEHRSEVFTVMTTNDQELQILPPELYRPGRIDRLMYLGKVNQDTHDLFVENLCSHLGIEIPKIGKEPSTFAELTNRVLHKAKKLYLTNATNKGKVGP